MQPVPLRILLIEDDPDDVWLIRDALSGRLRQDFEVTHFDRLSSALAAAVAPESDVALLDLTLPDSHGLSTFQKLQAHAPQLPIIVLTGFDDETLALEAVQAGAQDYLIKAQVDDNLLVRSIRYAIERSRLAKTEQMLQAAEAKMRVAREIQQRLFPRHPPHVPGFDIAGASFPADATGGDYFDFIPLAGGTLGLVIADVSGHGVGPAFLMAETRACLRALALDHDDPGEILTLANRLLADDTDDFHFVTLMLARLDPVRRRLLYASAGHASYLIDTDGSVQRLDSTSLPLGVERETTFPCAAPLNLVPGQLLLLLTDGIVENCSPSDEMFGLARVLSTVQTARHLSSAAIVAELYRAVREFSGDSTQQDDITAVVVQVECLTID